MLKAEKDEKHDLPVSWSSVLAIIKMYRKVQRCNLADKLPRAGAQQYRHTDQKVAADATQYALPPRLRRLGDRNTLRKGDQSSRVIETRIIAFSLASPPR